MKSLHRKIRHHPTTVCAWCKGVIHRGEGKVSHGICAPCREKWFGKMTGRAAFGALPLPNGA